MINRSLAFKWIGTLLLTSLVGVVLIGLFAYRTTITEFDHLRMEQAQANFVNLVASYYRTNRTWDGVTAWLEAQSPAQNPPVKPFWVSFALVDEHRQVMVEAGPFQLGDSVSEQQVEQGTPIIIDGQQVGTVVNAAPPPGPDPHEQQYLSRTNQALLIGAIGSVAVALLVGLLLSRRFLRPLTELTAAIRAIRQGELSQQVEVRTEDELGELAQAFNQMSAEIHKANQLRKQMTADIAHDLRTPLTVIMGYLEGLRDGTLKATPQRFDAMYNESILLNRLIDDLRTLSLADAGELKLMRQPIAPREILEQVAQSFEPIAEEEQVTLQMIPDDSLPNVQIDRERIVQVLANLVSNALRYTPPGGKVTLQAHKRGDSVQIVVSDTGTGIEADKLPNIFERFYRVEESRHQNQGESGLGLAIAKSLVEAHQGTITAESRVGAGTSIIITLPAATETA